MGRCFLGSGGAFRSCSALGRCFLGSGNFGRSFLGCFDFFGGRFFRRGHVGGGGICLCKSCDLGCGFFKSCFLCICRGNNRYQYITRSKQSGKHQKQCNQGKTGAVREFHFFQISFVMLSCEEPTNSWVSAKENVEVLQVKNTSEG